MAEFRRSHRRWQATFGILACTMQVARIYPLARPDTAQMFSVVDTFILALGMRPVDFKRILLFGTLDYILQTSWLLASHTLWRMLHLFLLILSRARLRRLLSLSQLLALRNVRLRRLHRLRLDLPLQTHL